MVPEESECELECKPGRQLRIAQAYSSLYCGNCSSTTPQQDCNTTSWRTSKNGTGVDAKDLKGACKKCRPPQDPVLNGTEYKWECSGQSRVPPYKLHVLCSIECPEREGEKGHQTTYSIQCEPYTEQLMSLDVMSFFKHEENRWVVNGTNTTYKEEEIELECADEAGEVDETYLLEVTLLEADIGSTVG